MRRDGVYRYVPGAIILGFSSSLVLSLCWVALEFIHAHVRSSLFLDLMWLALPIVIPFVLLTREYLRAEYSPQDKVIIGSISYAVLSLFLISQSFVDIEWIVNIMNPLRPRGATVLVGLFVLTGPLTFWAASSSATAIKRLLSRKRRDGFAHFHK